MGLAFADAYAQIKELENTGRLSLPETQETVEVGTIDPAAGTFTWTVPTVTQTIVIPPLSDPEPEGPGPSLGNGDPATPFIADNAGGGTDLGGTAPPHHGVGGIPPTNQIIDLTVGVVATKAVVLRLRFAVIPQRETSRPVAMQEVAPGASGGKPAAAGTTAEDAAVGAKVPVVGGVLAGETNGGVTITGFPTVSSEVGEITIDVGLACSQALPESPEISPPVSRFEVTINIPGHDAITAWFFILRPPVVGMGAFTIPALPMAIVYAPPQTQQLKNVATYSDTETFTRTVTSSITTSTNTKTVQAYSAADLISKVAGAITAVAAVVGTGGAGATGDASVAGALSELGTALFGKAKSDNDSTADATKQISSELSLVSDIVNGIDASAPPADSAVSTNQSDQSITLTLTQMSQYQSAAGSGPGSGDRIVYLKDVKVVWMAVNGEVGIIVLGYAGPGANAVKDLVEERQRLAAGEAPNLGFNADTIESLLAQDPMAPPRRPVAGGVVKPPAIGPPRFVPADPSERTGTSTGPNGDTFSVTFESTTEDKEVTTSSQTHIEDSKPGWLAVLFGADDNVETTTTTTFTMSHTTDNKADDKLTSSVTFFSAGDDDKYDALNFYDYTFGTYAYLPPDSPFLRGTSIVGSK